MFPLETTNEKCESAKCGKEHIKKGISDADSYRINIYNTMHSVTVH